MKTLLALFFGGCIAQTLSPGIIWNKSGGVLTQYVTPICMLCKPNNDVNWFDISYAPSSNLGYMPTKCVIRGRSTEVTQIELWHTDPVGNTIYQKFGGIEQASDATTTCMLTQPVSHLSVWMKDAEKGTLNDNKVMGLYFYHIDGTKTTCGPGISTIEYEFKTDLQLRITGMKCVFRENPIGSLTSHDRSFGCTPYIETCQSPDKPFDAKTIPDMSFTIMIPANPATNQDINLTQQGGVIGCGPRTYTLTPTRTFLTSTGNVANGYMTGNIMSVSTTNPADEGVWPQTLTVSLTKYPTISFTKNFNVIIICQVSTMSFNQVSPITATYIVGIDTNPLTFLSYSVTKTPVCLQAPTFTLVTAPAFVTSTPSGNSGNLAINGATAGSTNRPSGSQLHTFTLTGAQGVASAQLTVNLTLKCGVTAITVTQQPADASFVLNQGSIQTLSLNLAQTQDCWYPFTYTHAVTKNGSAVSMPAWLTFDNVTLKFTYAPSAPTEVGVYVITTTSTIPNIVGVTQVTSKVTSWTLTVLSDCTITTLTNRALLGMTAFVSTTSDSQSIVFQDSIGTSRGNVAYCGARTYTLAPALAFLSISGDTLTLAPFNTSQTGTYTVTLTISLTSWPSRPSISANFTVLVKCTSTISIMSNTIPGSSTYTLNPNSLATLTLTTPTLGPTPSGCPFTPVYSVKNTALGTCPTWITCAPTLSSNIVVATMDWTLEGTYNFRIDFLDSESGFTNSAISFTIIINIMNATSITMATTPGNQVYTVNASTLFVDLPAYTWYPTQSHTIFTYSKIAGPSFVTIAASPLKIQVYTLIGSNTGTYTVTIRTTETNSGLAEDRSFTLLVKCVQSINTAGALSDVLYYITDPAITRTPLYSLTPSDCTYELVLTVTLADNSPLPASITYTAPNISVYSNTFASNASYAIKIVATDPKSGMTNSALMLNVSIKCSKTISLFTNTIPATTTYVLNPNSLVTNTLTTPTFSRSPSSCPFAPVYSVKNTATSNCPAWITCTPTIASNILIATTDWTLEGTFNFRIDFTDTESGLTDNSVVFTVVIQIMNATSMTMTTTPPNQVYMVNDPAMLVNLPTYNWYPTQSHTAFTYAKIAGPSFVTISGSPLKIQIYTTAGIDTGYYTVTIRTTETNSNLSNDRSFSLLVKCVQSMVPSATLADVTYWITDPVITRTPLYLLTPSDCKYELVLTVTLTDDSPLPASITHSLLSPAISIYETNYALTSTYQVKVLASDPKTGLTNSSLGFQVVIKCTKTINLVSGSISGISYQIDLDQPWFLVTPLPAFQQNPVECAVGTLSRTLTYTGSGASPAFITQVPASNIHIETVASSSIGTYNYKIVATDSLTGLVNQQNTFLITIVAPTLATDLVLVAGTAIANQNYLIGEPAFLLAVPTYTIVPSNADISFTWTLGASTSSFVTVVQPSAGVYKVQIVTASSASTGIYSIELTFNEQFSLLKRTTTFVLTVSCVRSISMLSTVPPALYYINDPFIDVIVPLYTIGPASCPYELTYSANLANGSALPNSIALLTQSGSHFLRLYENNPLSTGVYSVRISVLDPKTSLTHTMLLISVTVLCTKQLSLVTNPVPPVTDYTVNKSQLLTTSLNLPTYQPTPGYCKTGSLTYQVMPEPAAPIPTFITEYPTTKINIATTDPAKNGSYDFRLLVTDPLTGLQNSVVTFHVDIHAISTLNLVATTAIPDQVYRVGDPTIILGVPQYTTGIVAQTKFTYTLVGATPSFVVLVGSGDQNSQVQIVTSDYTKTDYYMVTIQTYEEYSQITKIYNFNLLVTCVKQLITANYIANRVYYIGDPYVSIPVPTYIRIPGQCPKELTYVVKQQNGSALPVAVWFNAVPDSEFIGIYESDTSAAAFYTIVFKAIDQKTLLESDQITFTITIRLRAEGLNIVSGTELPNINYLVGSPELLLSVPNYVFWPSNANIDPYETISVAIPAFVSLHGDPKVFPKIRIFTTSSSDTGIYSISITFTDLYSGLFMTDTFQLTVSCVQVITQPTFIPEITYWITNSNINQSFPVYSINPGDCPYEMLITAVTQQNGNALPNAIKFDGTNAVDIYETDYLATGVYFVKVTSQDPKSQLKNFDLVFKVTVLCTKTIDIVVTNLPGSSSFEIDEKFLNTLTLNQPTFQPNPTQCLASTYTYQLADNVGSLISVPAFITAFDNSSLTVATIDKTQAGSYSYRIKVTESVSGLVNTAVAFTLQLTVKIYATDMNLVPSSIIAPQNYLISDNPLVLLAFQYSFVPSNSILNVEYSLVNAPSFVSLVLSGGTWVKVETTNTAHTGTYVIEVKTIDHQSSLWRTNSFTLVVSCVRQIAITAPLSAVVYYITDPVIKRYPTYNLTPAGCPNELVYTVTLQNASPLPGSITFAGGATPTISVEEQDYLLTNVFQVKVSVVDPKTGQTNSNQSLQVTILCSKTIEVSQDTVADFSYRIDLDQPWTKTVVMPSYVPNPVQCAVGTYTLEVIFTDVGLFPVFINQHPTTSLIVSTQDVSKVGAYNFKIKATESISGWINDSNAFLLTILEPIYTQALLLVSGTQITDFTYTLSDPVMYFTAPSYKVMPVNADKQFIYTLAPSTPPCVTLVPNASGVPDLSVVSNSNSDLGVFVITIVITEFWSNVQITQSFTLTVACVRSIDQFDFILPILYYTADTAIDVPIPLYSQTPASCPYQLEYSATLSDGSPLPNAIVLQAGLKMFTIYETDPNLTSVYNVKVKVLDAKSTVENQQLTFQVTVLCTKSIIVLTDPILDVYRLMEIDPLQTFTYNMPSYNVNPSFCLKGTFQLTIKYTGVPDGTAFPTWLSYDPSIVTINTSDNLGVQAYNFQVEAFEPLSGLSNTGVTFSVVSTNDDKATSITVDSATLIADAFYTVDDPESLLSVPEYLKFPSYVDVQYFYEIVPPQPFASVIVDGSGNSKMRISSSNPLHTGDKTISLKVTEQLSGLTHVTSFNLQIKCVRVITPTSTLASQIYYVYDPTLVVNLPIIQLTPLLCPNELIYSLTKMDGSPLESQFTLGTKVVNVQSTAPLLTGSFPLRVVLTDPKTGVTGDVEFEVIIRCSKMINVLTNPLSLLSYNVGADALVVEQMPLPTYIPQPADCLIGDVTFNLVYLADPSGPFPDFVSQFPSGSIEVATQSTNYLGLQTFKLVATDPFTGLTNEDVQVEISLYCEVQQLIVTEEMDTYIKYTPGSSSAMQVPLPIYETVPERCMQPYSVEFYYTQDPSFRPKWISLNSGNINIQTDDMSLIQDFQFYLVAEIGDVINDEVSFTVSFDCIITDIVASRYPFLVNYFVNPQATQWLNLPLPTFSVLPSHCKPPINVSLQTNSTLVPAERFVSIDAPNKLIVFGSQDLSILGTYKITMTASYFLQAIVRQFPFTVIVDCKITTVLMVPNQTLQTRFDYVIGQPALQISMPEYTTLPDGCLKPLTYVLMLTEIDGVGTNEQVVLPSFIRFDPINKKVTIQSAFGVDHRYTFTLDVTEPKSQVQTTEQFVFVLDVVAVYDPPYFIETLQDITLTYSDLADGDYVIKLPPVADRQNHMITNFSVKLGTASAFAQYNHMSGEIIIDNDTALLAKPGSYTVLIRLTDETGATSQQMFTIILKQGETTLETPLPPIGDILLSDSVIQSAEASDFMQPSKLPLSFPTNQNRPLTAQISKIEIDGSFQVTFSDEIMMLHKESIVAKKAVLITVYWMNDAIRSNKLPKPTYKVKVVDLDSRSLYFQLIFDEPELISRGITQDVVTVTFTGLDFFLRDSDQAKLDPKSRILFAQIPKQLESPTLSIDAIKQLSTNTENAEGVAVASMVGSALVGMPSMSLMGCFNTIQLISMQAYTSSEMPSNAANLFKTLDEFMRGGALNPGSYISGSLAKDQELAFADKRQLQATDAPMPAIVIEDQIQPLSPLVQASFFMMIILICVLLGTSLASIEAFISQHGSWSEKIARVVIRPAKRLFLFNLFIHAAQFGYLYFVLAGVQLNELKGNIMHDKTTLQIVNAVLHYIAIFYVSIYPVGICLFFLTIGVEGLKNKMVDGSFRSLYSGLDVSNKLKTLQVTVFLVRRAIVGMAIAFCRNYYFVQLEIFLISSMICLCYLILARPYLDDLTNYVEMINEGLVIGTIYFLHCFSYFVQSAADRYKVGWIYLSIVGVVFLINISVMLKELFTRLIKRLKANKKLMLWGKELKKKIMTKKPRKVVPTNVVDISPSGPNDPFNTDPNQKVQGYVLDVIMEEDEIDTSRFYPTRGLHGFTMNKSNYSVDGKETAQGTPQETPLGFREKQSQQNPIKVSVQDQQEQMTFRPVQPDSVCDDPFGNKRNSFHKKANKLPMPVPQLAKHRSKTIPKNRLPTMKISLDNLDDLIFNAKSPNAFFEPSSRPSPNAWSPSLYRREEKKDFEGAMRQLENDLITPANQRELRSLAEADDMWQQTSPDKPMQDRNHLNLRLKKERQRKQQSVSATKAKLLAKGNQLLGQIDNMALQLVVTERGRLDPHEETKSNSKSSLESMYSKQARLTGLKYKHTKGYSPPAQTQVTGMNANLPSFPSGPVQKPKLKHNASDFNVLGAKPSPGKLLEADQYSAQGTQQRQPRKKYGDPGISSIPELPIEQTPQVNMEKGRTRKRARKSDLKRKLIAQLGSLISGSNQISAILKEKTDPVAQDPWHIEPKVSTIPMKHGGQIVIGTRFAGQNVQKKHQQSALYLSDSDLDI